MNNKATHILYQEAIMLLQQLIAIPSLSREENKTADCIESFFQQKNIPVHRHKNNVWAVNKNFNPSLPSILLNSHHDTVSANNQYKKNPYEPSIKDGKLFGLGSTDAGASLVCMLAAFLYYFQSENLKFNIVFAASAEEEISGTNGIEDLFTQEIFKQLFEQERSFAIVGEPTQLQLAIAEKGLMVLDCTVYGKAGHAAREEGENAITKAMKAIQWMEQYRFPKKSDLLGEVKMTVTSIETMNKAHNIIPASCSFVVDVRVTDAYTMEEVLAIIKENIVADILPRGMRLRSNAIDIKHPVVQAGIKLGKKVYGSPTISDKALIPLQALKCGPGNSAQSHSADEYVLLQDVEEGIEFYFSLLKIILK